MGRAGKRNCPHAFIQMSLEKGASGDKVFPSGDKHRVSGDNERLSGDKVQLTGDNLFGGNLKWSISAESVVKCRESVINSSESVVRC